VSIRLKIIPDMISGFGDRLPALLGHPYALARTALRAEIKLASSYFKKDRLLDVGCGTMPYRSFFLEASEYHGLEIDQPRNRSNPNVTHWYDGVLFPLGDELYSGVICSQVLEHTFMPELLLSEIYRVLEPGGRLLLTIPFFWPEHEQPYDSQRFTSYGIIDRLQKVGFHEITVVKTNPGLSCLMQLGIEWMESCGRRFHWRLETLWRFSMIFPYTIMNLTGFLYRKLPNIQSNRSKADLYLDLVILAQR
jgi:SAM-dependent methyltransferase